MRGNAERRGADLPVWRRLLPYGVLLVEVIAFFWRVLFLPATYVIPWDIRNFHLPHAAFLARCLDAGYLPLWEPYTHFGRPFLANIQTQVFYPPRLLGMALNNLTGGQHVLYWLELELAAHVFLAGVFTYWLLRGLGTSRSAALVGATVYQLGGFFASQAQHLGAVNAAAWLPAAWLGVVKLRERVEARWVMLLSVTLALSVLSGLPAATFTVVVSSVMLAAGFVMARMATVRLPLAVAGCGVAGFLLSAIQLIPTIELHFRSIAKYRYEWIGSGGGLPVQSLVSLVAPNHYNIFDLAKYTEPWNPTFLYLYSSLGGLALAVAVVVAVRRPIHLLFAALTVLFGFAMLGDQTSAGKFLLLALPPGIRGGLHPEFFLPAFTLGISVLAGLGAAAFLKNRILCRIAVVAVAADLILVGAGRPMNTTRLDLEPGVTANAFEGSREVMRVIRSLSDRTTPPGRVDTIDDSMDWAMAAPYTRIPSANSNDPLALERAIRLRLAFCDGKRWGRYYQIDHPESPVLDLADVRIVLSRHRLSEEVLAKAHFDDHGEIPGRHVYLNPEALPRFFLVNSLKHAGGLENAARLLDSPDFDPRSEAIVEGDPPVEASPGPVNGRVRLIRYENNSVELEVATPAADAFLVTSEANYPGWRAWLDGEQQPIYYTDVAFRGLVIPAGKHRVVMRFEPATPWWGAAVSSLAWLGFVLVFLWRRRHRGHRARANR